MTEEGTGMPSSRGRRRRVGRATAFVAGGVVVLLGVLAGGYVHQNVTWLRRGLEAVAESGFVEKHATVDGQRIAYAEGPDNGPPLVLIHGQGSRWQDHMRVLPELAEDHHVFAVDVPGHGASDRLAPERYSNVVVGDLLAGFVDQVVGSPAIVSGHSSGGLLALHIAAAHPELVTGLFLEDPPLFSSQMPRLTSTVGGGMLVLADRYLAAGAPDGDFQQYFLRHGDYFEFFGPLAGPIARDALRRARERPGEPVQPFYLPGEVTVFFHGLVRYDPAFGAAWVRDGGRWYAGFDTEAALRSVRVPTTLLHTNYFESRDGTAYDDSGTLRAAMDSADVQRALALLPPDTRLVQVASGHLVHFEQARTYTEALRELSARVR
ncbi:MAG TPA: alpha/beta hydrolase [Pseudonocardia sp.]|jgi:pimeloyl-ACP methyl ester carboxylesterase|uniref:alpha/beta fold hydrolase n=1 Tax=Pseudonocardia sp. TaxID=60912 RepID=UPI002B4B327E|nr:alpha/beta hydrolase [Pseudonocardia sp.]HLU58968.1 alpha/beta hydrolase [Pseudonocardia sp.]